METKNDNYRDRSLNHLLAKQTLATAPLDTIFGETCKNI